jgi:chromosome partitioning protein
VVIPVQPSPFDLWAGRELIDWVWQAQLLKPRLAAAFVANRVITGSIVGRALSEALSRTGIQQLTAQISQRVIFAECSSSGRVVGELAAHGRAALEIGELAEELRGLSV